MRKTVLALFGMALLVWVAGPAAADPWMIDSFFDVFYQDGTVAPPPESGGTGYDGNGDGHGDWVYYPNTGWTNQWFYNAPLDMTRYKEIYYDIQIDPLDPGMPSQLTLVVNWSSPLYPNGTGAPPLDMIEDPPGSGLYRPIALTEEEEWIVRDVELWYGPVPAAGVRLTNVGMAPIYVPYNPEWVSVDIMGYNLDMSGTIWHACLPEPASVVLLSLASLALIRRR